MRILVTGGRGMLGKNLVEKLERRGEKVCVFDLPSGDVCDRERVEQAFLSVRPEVVFHLAAYTDVDGAEEERELAYSVNVLGSEAVSEFSKKYGAKIVYLSTDYVFGGSGDLPWRTDDEPSPVNFYGWSKREGEERVLKSNDRSFVVRTAWLYGDGKNFVRSVLAAAKAKKVLRVVDDQVGSPTYVGDLNDCLIEISRSEKYGIYHATGEGFCSRFSFAKKIFAIAEELDERWREIEVLPQKSEDYPLPAKRPKNGRLDKSKLEREGFSRLPDFETSLKKYLIEELKK